MMTGRGEYVTTGKMQGRRVSALCMEERVCARCERGLARGSRSGGRRERRESEVGGGRDERGREKRGRGGGREKHCGMCMCAWERCVRACGSACLSDVSL